MKLTSKLRSSCYCKQRQHLGNASHTETSRNLLWQSSQSNGSINQNAQFTNINVPTGMSSFVGAAGISVQLPKGSDLSTQIANLAKQPGLVYLNDLSTRSDIDWKRVEIINKTWDYKKEGLTPEASIAIAVRIATAGQGAELLNTLDGTVQGVAEKGESWLLNR